MSCWQVPAEHGLVDLYQLRVGNVLCHHLCNGGIDLLNLLNRDLFCCCLQRLHQLLRGYLPGQRGTIKLFELRCGYFLSNFGIVKLRKLRRRSIFGCSGSEDLRHLYRGHLLGRRRHELLQLSCG